MKSKYNYCQKFLFFLFIFSISIPTKTYSEVNPLNRERVILKKEVSANFQKNSKSVKKEKKKKRKWWKRLFDKKIKSKFPHLVLASTVFLLGLIFGIIGILATHSPLSLLIFSLPAFISLGGYFIFKDWSNPKISKRFLIFSIIYYGVLASLWIGLGLLYS